VLFFIAIAHILSDCEEVRVAEAVLVGGIGSIGDGVGFSRDVRGAGRLTGQLSHASRGGVVFAVGVVAEAGMLEGVFLFGRVDVGLRRPIEADGLSFDDFGIGR